jgi:hypothetical protein
VVVRKAVTADLTGEAVAGQVDIRTRSAFDYTGFKIAADLGAGFSELGGGRQYNFAGHISERFFNDTIGILLSASRFEVDMITDNFETDWELAPGRPRLRATPRVWARETENKLYRLTRSNTAFSGKLDWRPNANHELFLSSVMTEFRDDELRNNYIFDFDQNAVATSSTAAAGHCAPHRLCRYPHRQHAVPGHMFSARDRQHAEQQLVASAHLHQHAGRQSQV